MSRTVDSRRDARKPAGRTPRTRPRAVGTPRRRALRRGRSSPRAGAHQPLKSKPVVRPGRSVEMLTDHSGGGPRGDARPRPGASARQRSISRAGNTTLSPCPRTRARAAGRCCVGRHNYISAMEWRFAAGSFAEQGPARVGSACGWLSSRARSRPPFKGCCAPQIPERHKQRLGLPVLVYVNPDRASSCTAPVGEWSASTPRPSSNHTAPGCVRHGSMTSPVPIGFEASRHCSCAAR